MNSLPLRLSPARLQADAIRARIAELLNETGDFLAIAEAIRDVAHELVRLEEQADQEVYTEYVLHQAKARFGSIAR